MHRATAVSNYREPLSVSLRPEAHRGKYIRILQLF
jgi:hypothetical protein